MLSAVAHVGNFERRFPGSLPVNREVVVVGDRHVVVVGVGRVHREGRDGVLTRCIVAARKILVAQEELPEAASAGAGNRVGLEADRRSFTARDRRRIVRDIHAPPAAENRLAVARQVVGKTGARLVEERPRGIAGIGVLLVVLVPVDAGPCGVRRRIGIQVVLHHRPPIPVGGIPNRDAHAVRIVPGFHVGQANAQRERELAIHLPLIGAVPLEGPETNISDGVAVVLAVAA